MEEAVSRKKRGFAFNFRASLCIPFGVFMALFVVLPLFIIVYYLLSINCTSYIVPSYIICPFVHYLSFSCVSSAFWLLGVWLPVWLRVPLR